MKRIKPIDKKGRIIHKHDWVRIVEIPKSISKMTKETKQILKKSLGKTFKVESFDKYGHLQLDVWKKLKLKTMDTIWIEPYCVNISRSRKK